MTTALTLVLVASGLWAASGLPTLVARHRWLPALLGALASAIGLTGALLALLGGAVTATAAWTVPFGNLSLGLDGITAWFLLPVFAVPAIAAVYGVGYWRPAVGAPGQRLPLVFGLLVASLVLLLVARNAILFLFGWEGMAVCAFLLVGTEHRDPACRRAAWVYLVATHLGTLCLCAAFALLPATAGRLDWSAQAFAGLTPSHTLLVFGLALAGFGLKAGLMPLHFWLPAAHANAPSHISALMSGVMIKMGVYGVVRMLLLLPPLPEWCGLVLLGLGLLSALAAVAATLGQDDLKRLLAYSSIENIGIIFMAMGLAATARATGQAGLVALGLGAALLHTLNHSLFKSLLFCAAGAVIHGTSTRRLDALGGLAAAMPRTAFAFAMGAAAVAGLPLWNGFPAEYLVYRGLFEAVARPDAPTAGALAVAAVAGLAIVGGLAAVAFVRCTGAVFLGRPRSAAALHAHEAPASMTRGMLVLATLCVAVGVGPVLLRPLLHGAVVGQMGLSAGTVASAFATLTPFSAIAGACLVVLVGLATWLRRRAPVARPVGTWDCGYADAAGPRLQYTAGSLAQFSAQMLRWFVRDTRRDPDVAGLFPQPARFERTPRELLLDGVLFPGLRRVADWCAALRILQRGKLQIYLLYILLVLLSLLLWATITSWRMQ